MAKIKRTNNELLKTTQKTIDRETQTSLKTWDELRFSGRISSHCTTSGTLMSLRNVE